MSLLRVALLLYDTGGALGFEFDKWNIMQIDIVSAIATVFISFLLMRPLTMILQLKYRNGISDTYFAKWNYLWYITNICIHVCLNAHQLSATLSNRPASCLCLSYALHASYYKLSYDIQKCQDHVSDLVKRVISISDTPPAVNCGFDTEVISI